MLLIFLLTGILTILMIMGEEDTGYTCLKYICNYIDNLILYFHTARVVKRGNMKYYKELQ